LDLKSHDDPDKIESALGVVSQLLLNADSREIGILNFKNIVERYK